MITFWIVAALLTGTALLFVLPPLLRTGDRRHRAAERLAHVTIFNQQLEELDADLAKGLLAPEDYEQGRVELEARLLEDSRPDAGPAAGPARGLRRYLLPALILAGLPALVVGVYYQVGTPQILTLDAPMAPIASTGGKSTAPHAITQDQVLLMTTRLALRLQKNPQDADGWAMLARSYAMMNRYGDAAAAYGRAAALTPDNAQLLADYADTLAMSQGQRFEGKPADLIEQALKIDPDHPKALALAASAAFAGRLYDRAVETWEHLLRVIPGDSQFAASVRNSIADARMRGGMAAAAHAGMRPRVGAATGGAVRLIPELRDKVSPEDTVFVFASPPEGGPKMPLAVMRRQVKDLPFKFVLDDSMAMMPAVKMSNFKKVVIAARISKSGKVAVEKGDLVSQPAQVAVGDTNVDVLIRGIVR